MKGNWVVTKRVFLTGFKDNVCYGSDSGKKIISIGCFCLDLQGLFCI
jgi:hypothetical protein